MFVQASATVDVTKFLPKKTKALYTHLAPAVAPNIGKTAAADTRQASAEKADSSLPSAVFVVTDGFDIIQLNPQYDSKTSTHKFKKPEDEKFTDGISWSGKLFKCPEAAQYLADQEVIPAMPQPVMAADTAMDGSIAFLLRGQRGKRVFMLYQPRSPIAANGTHLAEASYAFSAVDLPPTFNANGIGLSSCGRRAILFSATHPHPISVDVEMGCPRRNAATAWGLDGKALKATDDDNSLASVGSIFSNVFGKRECSRGPGASYLTLLNDGRIVVRCREVARETAAPNTPFLGGDNTISEAGSPFFGASFLGQAPSEKPHPTWVTTHTVQLPDWKVGTAGSGSSTLWAMNPSESAVAVVRPGANHVYLVPLPGTRCNPEGSDAISNGVVIVDLPMDIVVEGCAWHPDGCSGVVLSGRTLRGTSGDSASGSSSRQVLLLAGSWGKCVHLTAKRQQEMLLEAGTLTGDRYGGSVPGPLHGALLSALAPSELLTAAATQALRAVPDAVSQGVPIGVILAAPTIAEEASATDVLLPSGNAPLLCFLSDDGTSIAAAHCGPTPPHAGHATDHGPVATAAERAMVKSVSTALRRLRQGRYSDADATAAVTNHLAFILLCEDALASKCIDEGYLQKQQAASASGGASGALSLQAAVRARQILGPLDENNDSNRAKGFLPSLLEERDNTDQLPYRPGGLRGGSKSVTFQTLWNAAIEHATAALLDALDGTLTSAAADAAATLLVALAELYGNFRPSMTADGNPLPSTTVQFAAACMQKAAMLRPFRLLLAHGAVEPAVKIAVALGNAEIRFCDEVYPAVAAIPSLRSAVRSFCTPAALEMLNDVQQVAAIASTPISEEADIAVLERKYTELQKAVDAKLPKATIDQALSGFTVHDVMRLAFLRQLQGYSYPALHGAVDQAPAPSVEDAANTEMSAPGTATCPASNAVQTSVDVLTGFGNIAGTHPAITAAVSRALAVVGDLSQLNRAATPAVKPAAFAAPLPPVEIIQPPPPPPPPAAPAQPTPATQQAPVATAAPSAQAVPQQQPAAAPAVAPAVAPGVAPQQPVATNQPPAAAAQQTAPANVPAATPSYGAMTTGPVVPQPASGTNSMTPPPGS